MHSTDELPTTMRPAGHAWRSDEERHELKLTFAELVLIYKALQAVKTLEALPRQDEVLGDAIEVVDRALTRAVREAS